MTNNVKEERRSLQLPVARIDVTTQLIAQHNASVSTHYTNNTSEEKIPSRRDVSSFYAQRPCPGRRAYVGS